MKRVLVLNGYGNNLGDQAIFAGFIRCFGEATESLGVDVALDQSFVYDFPFRDETIETINEHYDLVVLGGGGILYHRPEDRSASGWGFDIEESKIRDLRTPFAVYATGYNYRAYADAHFPAHTASHVRETVRRAAHFSVREQGSIAMLRERFGVEGGVDLVPDCALHVEPSRVHLPALRPGTRPVGVCLRLDRAKERFGEPFGPRFERFIGTLVETLKRLAVEDGRQIVFVPHLVTPTDIEVAALLRASLPPGSFVAIHDEVPSLYRGADLDVPSVLAAIYRELDVVIGQRLHSVVIPFSVGTPVVSASTTASNGWIQRDFGVDDRFHFDLCDMEACWTPDALTAAVREASAERRAWQARAFEKRCELLRAARGATRALVRSTLVDADERPSGIRPAIAAPA